MTLPADREAQVFFHTYKRIPLDIVRGEGVELVTRDGSRYLDMFSGIAVNALGYGHARLLKAIQDQADRYIHVSNYYYQEPQLRLAELLVQYSGFPRVFLANSGTEAVEGAIKIARKWGSSLSKTTIVSLSNAFHGRTLGALSLMDRPKYREGFEPLLPSCRTIELNNGEALRRSVDGETAAVVVECLQGEGGIRPLTQEFASLLAELHRSLGFLLIADEIQSGLGRTGKLFGFQHFGLSPDLVLLAKPLGGGLPLAAILGGPRVEAVLQPGMHGTTFGGNPVACAAGIVVLQEIMENGLMQRADLMGTILISALCELALEFPQIIREVRGAGLMIGVELTLECEPIVSALRDRRILLNCTDGKVLRFLPPFIIEEEHIAKTVGALREVLTLVAQAGHAEANLNTQKAGIRF
jgi:acetylornithine/N-succinyldiaminopimelate aminotransferase